jgi:DnaJ-class molecular chaperone
MEQILKDLGNDNLYKILKIEKYAGPEKIKKAYKKLIKVYHPDKNKDSNTVHIFESVRKAYEILQNSENKIAYDEYLKRKDEKASRIKTFSEKRKKFIDDLKKRENESKMQFKDDQHTKTPATDFFVKEKKKDSNEDDYMGSIGINKVRIILIVIRKYPAVE